MSFEALSCAMARVIVNYHAYQTQGSSLSEKTCDSGPLETMLSCSPSEIDQVLRQLIDKATTGTNSSRRTLLEYMQFGISLVEQAKHASTSDEIQCYQTQLTQFIQNLQYLLTTTTTFSFWPRSLSVSIAEGESLSIYLLSYTTAHAKKLLLDFFEEVELSSESTEAAIQCNMMLRFECQLRIKNQALEHELEGLNQDIMVLTATFDALTKKKSKPAPEFQRVVPSCHVGDELDVQQDGFEYISLKHTTEEPSLVDENKDLSQRIERAHQRKVVLEGLIKNCQSSQSQSCSLPLSSVLYSKDAKHVSLSKGRDEVSGVNQKMF